MGPMRAPIRPVRLHRGSSSFMARRATGEYGFGVIFRARPGGRDNFPLHSFDGKQEGCAPMGGVTFGNRTSVFYSTTKSCGNSTKGGTIWPENASSRNIEVLHAFNLAIDGGNPESAPALIGETLYGTTRNGGAHAAVPVHGLATLFSTALAPKNRKTRGASD
jgi:hypothetical protein